MDQTKPGGRAQRGGTHTHQTSSWTVVKPPAGVSVQCRAAGRALAPQVAANRPSTHRIPPTPEGWIKPHPLTNTTHTHTRAHVHMHTHTHTYTHTHTHTARKLRQGPSERKKHMLAAMVSRQSYAHVCKAPTRARAPSPGNPMFIHGYPIRRRCMRRRSRRPAHNSCNFVTLRLLHTSYSITRLFLTDLGP